MGSLILFSEIGGDSDLQRWRIKVAFFCGVVILLLHCLDRDVDDHAVFLGVCEGTMRGRRRKGW